MLYCTTVYFLFCTTVDRICESSILFSRANMHTVVMDARKIRFNHISTIKTLTVSHLHSVSCCQYAAMMLGFIFIPLVYSYFRNASVICFAQHYCRTPTHHYSTTMITFLGLHCAVQVNALALMTITVCCLVYCTINTITRFHSLHLFTARIYFCSNPEYCIDCLRS